MLEILYSVSDNADIFQQGNFKMYIVGNNGTYYYGFIDIDQEIYTVNLINSHSFRGEVSLLFSSGKVKDFKNNDIFLVSYNGEKVKGCIRRQSIRDIHDFISEEYDFSGLDFFNVIT